MIGVTLWWVIATHWSGPDELGVHLWYAIANRDREQFIASVPAVVTLSIAVTTVRAVWRRWQTHPAADEWMQNGRSWVPRRGREVRHITTHEAAHAITALAQGGRVTRADIIYTGGLGGCVHTAPPAKVSYGEGEWFRLVTAIAGHVCDIDSGAEDQGSTMDMADAMTHGLGLLSSGRRPPGYDGPWTLDAVIAHATDTARTLLATHTHVRTALATALYRTAGLYPLRRHRIDAIWAAHRPVVAPARATVEAV